MTNNLNTAEWIIVVILSTALLIFLILAIFLTVKLIKLSEQIKKIAETGQSIADKAEDVVENVRDVTATGAMAKGLLFDFLGSKLGGRKRKK